MSKDKDELKGFKTLVMWGDGKTKGNGKSKKFPAEIIEVSDSKDYLLKTMRKEETFSINTGKGCHKRIHKAKFTIESESESDDVESQSDEGSALCNDKCKYKKEALELKERVEMLENQIKRLNEQIDNGNGLNQLFASTFKAYVGHGQRTDNVDNGCENGDVPGDREVL
ncbi:uncharacterized protein LOC124448857 [Xenia sp. Carnegie-2017]|uniref:uncharacterized protein LOC124448857 n=1 Tax=Xenia sp. Carnegie-2017 TaxID=2897299 RepID=UPI001F03A84B|nr:uncharacterized protein LOC124448857 [Xenia sp. Carnegie-2017]